MKVYKERYSEVLEVGILKTEPYKCKHPHATFIQILFVFLKAHI